MARLKATNTLKPPSHLLMMLLERFAAPALFSAAPGSPVGIPHHLPILIVRDAVRTRRGSCWAWPKPPGQQSSPWQSSHSPGRSKRFVSHNEGQRRYNSMYQHRPRDFNLHSHFVYMYVRTLAIIVYKPLSLEPSKQRSSGSRCYGSSSTVATSTQYSSCRF